MAVFTQTTFMAVMISLFLVLRVTDSGVAYITLLEEGSKHYSLTS